MKKLILLSAVATLSTVVAQDAHATCFATCEARIVDSYCQEVENNTFMESDNIYTTGECYVQCCAPPSEEHPNGDCSTDYYPLDSESLGVLDANLVEVEDIEWYQLDMSCEGDEGQEQNLFLLSADLAPGNYYLGSDALDLGAYDLHAEFVVLEEDGGTGCNTTPASGATGAAMGFMTLLGSALFLRRRD